MHNKFVMYAREKRVPDPLHSVPRAAYKSVRSIKAVAA